MIPVPRMSKLGALSLPNSFLEGFEISWAGEDPWNHGFCLGSEDGRICFVGTDLLLKSGPFPVVESGEVINGVAFTDDLIAVSTRSEVVLWRFPESNAGAVSRSLACGGGAHDVRRTASGGFIAPLGMNGLLAIDRPGGKPWTSKIIQPAGKSLYFYQAIDLGSSDQGNIHACAVRGDGLAICVNNWSSGYTSLCRWPGEDIIDVHAINSPSFPRAALSLGIDNSLHFIYDVLDIRSPQTLRFDHLNGRAYGLLVDKGHVIILTSRNLYIIKNLATRFLAEQPLAVPTTVTKFSMEAVDVSLAFGRWLLVVMPDELLSIDTGRLAEDDGEDGSLRLEPRVHFGMEVPARYELTSAALT